MSILYCPKCREIVETVTVLISDATRYIPAEYAEVCPLCGLLEEDMWEVEDEDEDEARDRADW